MPNGQRQTGKNLQSIKETEGENCQLTDLEMKLQKLEDLETSKNLPLNVSMQLYALMKKVVEKEVNPKTVSAACQCASEIHKIIKLNMSISDD